jgi:hypothetical protein
MKIFLLNQKSFFITLMIINLFLFSSTAGFAGTKTWNGGVGVGMNWTTGANWLPVGAPAAGDDIVFNTAGTITFSTMPAASIAYNSLTISDGTVTLAGGAAITLTIGDNPGDDLVISGGNLTLGTNVNITLAANAFAGINSTFTINSGSNYNTDGSIVTTGVFGTIANAGTITSSAGKLTFGSGSAYSHNQNGGTIPAATWNAASSCIITGLTTIHPAGGAQTFGHLTYNCAGLTGNIIMTTPVSVVGNFLVQNTGSGVLEMTGGSFTVSGEFTMVDDFIISNTTDRTLTVLGDVAINGGTLDLCNGGGGNVGTLNIGGNLTIFGTVTETGSGSGAINFTGSVAKNFNQSGTLINNINFTFNNTGGITILGSTTLNSAVTLTSGIINIPSGVTLTIANGNVIGGSGFGAAKHINTQVAGAAHGILRVDNMASSVSYTFPMGNGTSYLPIILTPPNTSSFSVGVFTGITENGLPNGTAFTAAKKDKCVDAVWTINRNSGTLGVDMILAWPAALEGASFATYTTPQIGIAHWDNPAWGAASGTGDNSLNTATRPGVTVFSPFGVGKTPNVLPIKFSYMNAAKGNGYNTLYWKAACNSSEVSFDLERSTDGRNFSVINSITASQARCAQPFDYVDNTVLPGTVFYRIRSTEITGQVTYSTIVKLTDHQKDMLITAVLPNPVINQAQLSITTSQKDIVNLEVVSMEGKLVQRNSVQLQAGSSIINLDVATLQSGIYMIRGTFSNGQTNTLKFIKQ